MTDTHDVIEGAASPQDGPFETLIERAAAAKIATEVRSFENLGQGRSRLYALLHLPNGRHTRQVVVFPRDVETFLSIEFERFIILGDYVAFVDTISGDIEAQVAGGGPGGRFHQRTIQQLPGVEIVPDSDAEVDEEALDEEDTPLRGSPPKNWRLVVKREGISLEVSPASAEFVALLEQGVTIKLRGISTSTHEEAVKALERYSAAMLFELDLVYGLPVRLGKRRSANRRRRRHQPDFSPKFPRNEYAGQALELYQYGRTAAGLPLLEYLAYYQSLEYFFPFFAREQTVNSVRTQLLHPKFNAHDDGALSRLINLAAPAARNGMAEREQLRATIRACIAEADLHEFIDSLPEYVDHFCTKNQSIKGVGTIQLKSNPVDLRDQVADRIYAIRCRIVHSKQDGGGTSEEVLLPSSSEAESLQADIELLRLVAQQALVARAARV
ncbi:hypothetical protein [Rathayibacter sp. VKM Ac-2927]|uniref:hypothetical protein n=1 Tax=Rathayibacter sp. VKM Ac-2927 TaxID=2929478 RepID=UPI001FB49AA2|nr:hypothetical protein [Rathayibacter sp. VKM Ac-2927]MCJ1688636.1 hypothetical protein [Rathayibacter sp. VKM Ac-2927]